MVRSRNNGLPSGATLDGFTGSHHGTLPQHGSNDCVTGISLALDLKHYFADADDASIADANDILRPYTSLVPIRVDGARVFLPDNNSLWRGMQFWGLMTGEITIDFGLFCIAGTCKNCKSRIKRPGSDDRVSVLACQTRVEPGLEIVRLAPGFVFRKKQGRPWDTMESPDTTKSDAQAPSLPPVAEPPVA